MKTTLAKDEDSESDTCHSKYKVKEILAKIKARKNYRCKSESDTCENKGAQKVTVEETQRNSSTISTRVRQGLSMETVQWLSTLVA